MQKYQDYYGQPNRAIKTWQAALYIRLSKEDMDKNKTESASIANQRTTDKMSSFIDRVGNPYLFKVGKTIVKVEYESGRRFADAFATLIRAG